MLKKISLLLVFTMLMSVFCATGTIASSTILYEYDDFADFGSFVRGDTTEAKGVGGAASDDSSVKISLNDDTELTAYMDLSWGKITSGVWDKSSYTGYLVNEYSIMTNSSATYVWLCTNQNSTLSTDISTSLNSNQWNRVVAITDRTGGANNGKTATYVNGVLVNNWTTDKLGTLNGTTPRNVLRFLVGGTKNTPFYMDNIKSYETDTLPDVAPLTIKGTNFAGTGGYLTVSKDVTLKEIISAGYNARAYTDKTFTTALGENDIIEKGNVVTVYDSSNILWYYELNEWDGITEITSSFDDMTLSKATSEKVYGVLGKDSDDESNKLTDSDTATDIFYQLSYKPKNVLSAYLVFEANVAPTADGGYVYLGTNGNSAMSAKAYVGNEMKSGKWNKLSVVYNLADKKADTYINGVAIAQNTAGVYDSNSNSVIRLLMVGTEGNIYTDDLHIYESATYPQIYVPDSIENGFCEDYGIIFDAQNNIIQVRDEKKLSDISGLFPGSTVNAYADSTFSETVNNSTLKKDNIIVVSDEKVYTYYTVEIFKENDIIVLSNRYNKEYNSIYDGEINIIATVESDGMVLSALYNKENIPVCMDYGYAQNGFVNFNFRPENADEGYVKLFIWEGTSSLKPIGSKKEISYTDGQVICFLGDSITQNGKYIRELYEHYLGNKDALPGVEMYNCGIPGDKTTEALARIDTDCLNYNPDVVFVCFGVNHLNKTYYYTSTYDKYTDMHKQIMETYTNETEQIINKILATGAKVVLCTPPPHNDTAADMRRNDGLAEMAEIIYDLADKYDLDVVDYFNAMKDLDYATYIMTDNVHPNDRGHHVMAQTILKTFGYTDTIDTGEAITSYTGTNDQRHTLSYNYRLVLLKDKEFSNLETIDERYEAAYAKMLAQTDSHQKFIYQNYCDNCYRIPEMKQEYIELTKLTACK